MKKLILTTVIIIAAFISQAQYALSPGDNQLNAGVGASSWGFPVYIGFDHGLDDLLSVGAQAGFRSYNRTYFGAQYRNSVMNLTGNVNLHVGDLLDLPENIDLYGGANIGVYIWSYGDGYYESGRTGLGIGLQVGGRYYFSDKAAINLEFGGGYNSVGDGKVGISIKL
jgi:hypothetical protein